VYRNVSIPGTGIWTRDRIGGSSAKIEDNQPADFPNLAAPQESGTEIKSSSTELLTTEGLSELKNIVKAAYEERAQLTLELNNANGEAASAERKYHSWERGFLFKRLFPKVFVARQRAFEMSSAKAAELQEQLDVSAISTQIEMDAERADLYFKMRDAFAALCQCHKIWDTLTEGRIDRVRTRSAASSAITRSLVKFSLGQCDLIRWNQEVPHLENRNGGDLFIYPGFVLYRESPQAFALIESQKVRIECEDFRFMETEEIPSDSKVVDHVWAKSNRDGSRDLRFKENHQIPVVHYGSLSITSCEGRQEEYHFSNPDLAGRLSSAWNSFQKSFK
jgi:hypothetical protein